MKTINTLLSILIIFFVSCSSNDSEIQDSKNDKTVIDTTSDYVDTTTNTTETDNTDISDTSHVTDEVLETSKPPETPVIPEESPTGSKIILSLFSANLQFYNENDELSVWNDCHIARAESKIYSCDDILYYLDEYGNTETTDQLIDTPDIIRLNNTDIWIVKNIDPETAYAGGAMYKDYTKIYYNNSEYGTWSSRQYKTVDMKIVNNEIFVKSENSIWYNINGSKINIRVVTDDFVMHDYNSTLRTAKINDILISWTTNFMNSAREWQKSGDTWYSENGYTWNGSTLIENGSIMTDWRTSPYLTGYTESPILISAGNIFENGETVLYWIECNSGYVIRYIPSINKCELGLRIYSGDGLRTTGLYQSPLLKQVIIENTLYYIYDAQLYRYNMSTGINSVFMSGISYVTEY